MLAASPLGACPFLELINWIHRIHDIISGCNFLRLKRIFRWISVTGFRIILGHSWKEI
jgi:hypothetical protein